MENMKNEAHSDNHINSNNHKINSGLAMTNARILDIRSRQQLKAHLLATGADRPGVQVMLDKADYYHIYLQNVSLRAANIIKQEMLSKGGDASVHKNVSMLKTEQTDILLFGSYRQMQQAIINFKKQPFGLKALGYELEQLLKNENKNKNCTNSLKYNKLREKIKLPLGERTLVMGILNVTPDSFSDGGRFNQVELAVAHARQMLAEGADIIDIGGESTRPGAEPISLNAELARVLPIITAIRKELATAIISIDTYKAEVADAAISAGANIINDVWAAQKDRQMAIVMAKHQVPVILMHNRQEAVYDDLLADIVADLRHAITSVQQAGVDNELIILDPGIGFAKDYQQNLQVMNRLSELTKLGYPVLLGTSRKSLIAKTLDLPVSERLEGTAATVTLGIERGVDIVRVHDVKEMKRVCLMTDAMLCR